MTHPDDGPAIECLRNTISGFLMPFFLAAAGGNPETARAAILALIGAYNAGNLAELDLAGRTVGFGIVAMDNLRLSMSDGMSDSKVLRYRSNAVSLSRAAEQARQILRALQDKQETTRAIPRPAVAAAPPPKPEPARPATAKVAAPNATPMDIEAMKREARIMMGAFSKHQAVGGAAILAVPNAMSLAKSAARAAVTAAVRPAAA
jgi:hypothetical protein